ncbi:zinc knuckle CX2CX4HX4C containing protein [Tanacetum coccineum]
MPIANLLLWIRFHAFRPVLVPLIHLNKVATAGTRDTPSTNGEDGSVNVSKNDISNGMGPDSYANRINGEPKISSEVKERFKNYVYGFFLGKKVAYPVVENFVKNSWSRFGLVRIMMNSNGIFFFKFSSSTGMESMLESRPWLICKVPLDLRKWSPLVNIAKEDLKSVPV